MTTETTEKKPLKVGDFICFENDDRWNGLIVAKTDTEFLVVYDDYDPRWESKETIQLNCLKVKTRKKRKSFSRASRLGDICTYMRSKVEEIRSIVDEEGKTDEDKVTCINAIIDGEFEVGDVEELRDEIVSWKENIEEKFSNTEKYAMLEDCESSLDGGIDELENAKNTIDELDEASNVADELESAIETLEYVEFPGMY